MGKNSNIRFTGINLFEAMERVVDAHTTAYKEDFKLDMELLRESVETPERASRTFLWMCRTMGTWLLEERNVFLKDTREHNTLRFYREQTSEPILLFAVEATKVIDGIVMGNLYLLDYGKYYGRVVSESLEADTVMHYEGGSRIIPAKNVTLHCDGTYGELLRWEYIPKLEHELSLLLWKEKLYRESFKVGDIDSYIVKLQK